MPLTIFKRGVIVFTDDYDVNRFPALVVLKSLPRELPELVMPLYSLVDLRRIRTMSERCLEKGIFSETEAHHWWQFLEREEGKEQRFQEAEQIVYCKENGNFEKTVNFFSITCAQKCDGS